MMLAPLILLAQGEPSYTTYGSFQELLQGTGARYPALIRVSDPERRRQASLHGILLLSVPSV